MTQTNHTTAILNLPGQAPPKIWIYAAQALAIGFVLVNLLALLIVEQRPITDSWHYIVWLGCVLGSGYFLRRHLPHHNQLLWLIPLFLSGWGILLIDRLTPAFADRQTIWLLIGTTAMVVIAIFPQPLRWVQEYRYLILGGGLLLLIATILFGQNPSGILAAPQLWLRIGDVYFQPSEALKIILVGFLASYLAEQAPLIRFEGTKHSSIRQWLSPRILGPMLLMWGLAIVLVIWQRDLGAAVIFFTVFILLLYAASGFSWLLVIGGLGILIAGFAAYTLIDLVQLRIDIWLYPWAEADGRAYQIVQSLMAFGSGGIWGEGIAQGYPYFIPVVHSDFVYAALAEEWGFLGSLLVIICIVIICSQSLQIAARHRNPFFALFTLGLGLLIGVQCALIMGGVLKLIPLTGVTLFFMSYGGSSLVAAFCMIGFLLRLSAIGQNHAVPQ